MSNKNKGFHVLPGRARERSSGLVVPPGDKTPETPPSPEEIVKKSPNPAGLALATVQGLSTMLLRDETETNFLLAHLAFDSPNRPAIEALRDRLAADRKRIMALYEPIFMLTVAGRGLSDENLAVVQKTLDLVRAEIQTRQADATKTTEKGPAGP